MKRALSSFAVLLVVIAVAGCAGIKIVGPNYNPPVAKLPAEVAEALSGKKISIYAPNGTLGVIQDAVLGAGGRPLLRVGRGGAEIEIMARIHQTSSGQGNYYSPVPLVPLGPSYRIRVEIVIYESNILSFRGAGEHYFGSGQISRDLATETATYRALANLRGGRR